MPDPGLMNGPGPGTLLIADHCYAATLRSESAPTFTCSDYICLWCHFSTVRGNLITSNKNWVHDKSTLFISFHSDVGHYIIIQSHFMLSISNCHFNWECEAVSKYWSHCCSAWLSFPSSPEGSERHWLRTGVSWYFNWLLVLPVDVVGHLVAVPN